VNRLFNHAQLLLATLMLALLGACAQVGLQAPQDINDRIQYGYAAVGAAHRTIGDLVAARTLDREQAAAYVARLDHLETQIQLADTLLRGGRPTDAVSTLNLALNALVALRSELAAKKGS
jgi:hypothetical protein